MAQWRGRVGTRRIPRPRGAELVTFFGGKLVYFGLAVVLPFALHPWLNVLLVWVLFSLVLGIVLATVFQLAHCVQEADFFKPAWQTYAKAEELIGLDRSQCLFVANHAFDCIGAKSFGMRTAFIDRRRRPFGQTPHQPDLIVSINYTRQEGLDNALITKLKGLKSAAWFVDNPFWFSGQKKFFQDNDFVFVYDPVYVEKMQELGIKS